MLGKIERISLISLTLLLTIVVFGGTLVRYLPLKGGLLPLGTLSLGLEEFGRLSVVWLWLAAGTVVHRTDEHYRLSVVFDRLPGKIRAVLMTIADVIVLSFLIVVTISAVRFNIYELGNTTLNLQWPALIFSLPLLLACPLMVAYTSFRLVSRIKGGIPGK